MGRALLIVDVQNDFTEGGALAVEGGDAIAARITRFLSENHHGYDAIVASRDWHAVDDDNGGHFSDTPDYVDSWPVHCVAGTPGAEYDPWFDSGPVTHHLKKGQGVPAYSMFEGISEDGDTLAEILDGAGIDSVDVAGLATDHCVRATSHDALAHGVDVRILTDLIAGVAPEPSQLALQQLEAAGATLATTRVI
ncbi:isochorismatase family protein [Microbacterium amylolyticum]|uniref:nicotinamidase n=1 Tax=Microbacterium amylolyticum TaxID=936337 RepID=A0ABS4ZJN7_9MICO|nr:isochorismatase family protein [Microbacterium amylolyticum]MBP2437502.1 nicotinamidase/pyrazinamidase [Microbacterium amylolyticum]